MNEEKGGLTCSTDLSKPATRAEGEAEGEGEDEGEAVETDGLVVATGVEGVEGAGEGVNPRGPPAIAPAAPGAAPALLSTSATRKQGSSLVKNILH